MNSGTQAKSSAAFFLGLQLFTLFMLIAELVRLTTPEDFFWFEFSPFLMNGPSLLAIMFSAFAALAIVRPKTASTFAWSAPLVVLALAMLVNLAWLNSLSWWAIIAAGLVSWCLWLLELNLCLRAPPAIFILAPLNFAVLLFLYLDTRFFVATNSHLNVLHLWFLRFSGVFAMAGFPASTFQTILTISCEFAATIIPLGYLLRDRIEIPPWHLRRVFLGAILIVLHFLQFDHLAGLVSLPDYLKFRFQFSTRFVPQAKRFQQPDFLPDPAKSAVNSDRCYRPGKFAWKSPRRPNLALILIESWRSDLFEVCMPKLRKRAQGALWLRNHFAQANSTPPTLLGLFYGNYPLQFLLHFSSLAPPPFFQFLKESGYQMHFVPSIPIQVAQGIEVYHEGFENHFPADPSATWPTMTKNAFNEAISLLERGGMKFIEIYIYTTHFDYRYPPEYDRYKPALPENTDVLSLTPSPETIAGITNRYKTSLLFLDDALDKFFTRFESLGHATDTLFLIVGDHGESLGDSGFFAHATGPHDVQFHVPCLIVGPGIEPRTIEHMTQHIDVIPTLGNEMGFSVDNLVGENARTASHAAILNFDFSADNRVIVRSANRMSLFDLDSVGRPSWVLTMRNDFTLDGPLFQAYAATSSSLLSGLVREDFGRLFELFGQAGQGSR